MKNQRSLGLKAAAVVAAALTATGMAGTAQAVALNPDGLGQVLVYPYYTVRANADGNAYDSLLTVVNQRPAAKAVRVRFREGKAGHSVLEFNLYLSEYDVWAAAITQRPDGAGAMIKTWDTSCTSPPIPADGVAFKNTLFSYANADGEDATADRTKEGYVEIIEMADILPNTFTWKNVTHTMVDGEWKPLYCSGVQDSEIAPSWANTDLTTGSGGLFGNMTLINVNTARAVGYDAVALSRFYKGGDGWGDFDGGRVPDTLWFPSGSENPNLSMAYPPTSTVLGDEADVVQSTWINAGGAWNGSDWVNEMSDAYYGVPERLVRSVFKPGLDAVSSVLMRSAIINEFNVAEVYAGVTDWVITMPTKNLYFDRGDNSLKPRSLFQNEFRKGGSATVSSTLMVFYNREERRRSEGDGGYFISPCENGSPFLFWAANIIQFQRPGGSGTVFPSSIARESRPPDFDTGWAAPRFCSPPPTLASSAVDGVGHVFTGVPVIGFAATLFNNAGVDGGSLGRVWASYVATVPHRYERNIQ